MSDQADIVIIGGGIVGCSVAYALTRRGVRNVLLLERRAIASGPTGASAGILSRCYQHPTLVAMAEHGRDFYARCEAHTGRSADFVRSGWLLIGGEAQAPHPRTAWSLQRAAGLSCAWLSPADIKTLEPRIEVEEDAVALYLEDAGYADPYSAAHALAGAAREAGAAIAEHTEVAGIETDGQGVCGVRTRTGTIATRTVVNAAGSWADRIGNMVGVTLPIETSRHQLVGLRRPSSFGPGHPVIADPANMVYLRPEGRDITIVGSNDPKEARNLVDPDRCPVGADPEAALVQWQRACARMPALAGAGMVRGWSGVYDISPDGFPIVDGPLGPQGFYCVTGLSGRGFKFAPAIGRIVASLILDSSPDPWAEMFRLGRFDAGVTIPAGVFWGGTRQA